MVIAKDSGLEIAPGIEIPWGWIDGILCGIIEKGADKADALAITYVGKLDDALQALVDNNNLKFDNVGKDTLCEAITLGFVKRYKPELLE